MQGKSIQNPPKTQQLAKSDDKAFYTDINESDPNLNNLRKYVDNLQSKIDYAKWKQSLVLKYNYMPMKRIAQKVQNDKINYVKKCAEEEIACAKILSGKQITVQLDLFREFSIKLDQKLRQVQHQLTQAKIKKQMLSFQAEQKRKRLKQLMKENMQLIKNNLHQEGIQTKEDMIELVRSKSTKDRFIPTTMTVDSNRTNIKRKISSVKLTNRAKMVGLNFNHKLYQECLSKLIQSIQSMKTSQDIQSGIYLDVMQKVNRKRYESQAKFSLKSNISNTLHSKFGSGYIQNHKLEKEKNDFQMQWETFKQLNWKQILGIVMVKDKNCQKIKLLLKYK